MNSYKILTYLGTDPAIKPYEALIYSSFLHSLRYGNEWFKEIESEKYYQIYHRLLEEVLHRSDSVVRLAVLSDDFDLCLGWSLAENNKLHFIFVKEDRDKSFRKQGLGTSLLPKQFDTITQLTKIGRIIWKKKYPTVVFDPFQ